MPVLPVSTHTHTVHGDEVELKGHKQQIRVYRDERQTVQ
jgi:hypothetical protein